MTPKFPPDGSPPASFPLGNSSSWTLWAQFYCVNPPADSCIYEYVCPNAAITGIGQQVSTFITEIIFTFLLAYWPKKIRTTMYAHLALVFSSYLAAIVGLALRQVTKNDAIFVIIMVASPTSIYVWITTLLSLWRPSLFPGSNLGIRPGEIIVMKGLCLLSLLFEIGLALAVGVPKFGVKFSQAACFQHYSAYALLQMIWPAVVFVPPVLLYLLLWLNITILRRMVRSKDRPISRTTDVVGWLHGRITDFLHNEKSNFADLIIAIVQLRAWGVWMLLPSYVVFGLDFLVFAGALFQSVRRRCFTRESGICLALCIWDAALLVLAFVPGLPFNLTATWVVFPINVALAVMGEVDFLRYSASPALVRWMWAVGHVFLIGTCLLLAFFPLPFLLPGRGQEFLSPVMFGVQNFCYGTLAGVISGWIAGFKWPTTSERSWRLSKPYRDLMTSRAHLLKFGLIVAYPNVVWVIATRAADPTKSAGNTFGQTFSILAAASNALIVLVEIRDLGRKKLEGIFLAVIKSEELPEDADVDDKDAVQVRHPLLQVDPGGAEIPAPRQAESPADEVLPLQLFDSPVSEHGDLGLVNPERRSEKVSRATS